MARLGVDEHAGAIARRWNRSPMQAREWGDQGCAGRWNGTLSSAVPPCSLKTDTAPFRQEVRNRRSWRCWCSMHSASTEAVMDKDRVKGSASKRWRQSQRRSWQAHGRPEAPRRGQARSGQGQGPERSGRHQGRPQGQELTAAVMRRTEGARSPSVLYLVSRW